VTSGRRSRGSAATVVVMAAWISWWHGHAGADDVHLDSDTSFQAYEVRSPGTAALMTRRRLVQSLGFTWMRDLVEPEDAGAPVPRLAASLRLRLDQDFGDTCLVHRDLCIRATNPDDPATYQPLASDTVVDAPEAWVEVRGLPLGLRARVGRHLRGSVLGFVRVDGASARIEPRRWAAVEAYGGRLVRGTSVAGTDAFAPEGALRLSPDGTDRDRAPFLDEPSTTWVGGGALEIGRAEAVRGAVRFREVRDGDGLVGRRGALSLASEPVDALRVSVDGAWDLSDAELVDAVGAVTVRPSDEVTTRATVEHHVPTFDLGTIWAYFDLVPVSEASATVSWEPARGVELGGGLRGRRADFGDGDELDAGAEGTVRFQLAGVRVGLSGFAWGGDLGPVAAVLLDAWRPVGSRVRLELRASAWHFDDPLRAGLYGTSVSEAAGVRFELTRQTWTRLSVEHAHSRVAGHRFRGLAALAIEVWR